MGANLSNTRNLTLAAAQAINQRYAKADLKTKYWTQAKSNFRLDNDKESVRESERESERESASATQVLNCNEATWLYTARRIIQQRVACCCLIYDAIGLAVGYVGELGILRQRGPQLVRQFPSRDTRVELLLHNWCRNENAKPKKKRKNTHPTFVKQSEKERESFTCCTRFARTIWVETHQWSRKVLLLIGNKAKNHLRCCTNCSLARRVKSWQDEVSSSNLGRAEASCATGASLSKSVQVFASSSKSSKVEATRDSYRQTNCCLILALHSLSAPL